MRTPNIIIAHPKTVEQANAVTAFMKALQIKFETSNADKSPYKADFVAKIEKSKEEFKNGAFDRVKKDDLQNLLGLE